MNEIQEKALSAAENLVATPKSLEKVAKSIGSTDVARWAFTQWELRKRGAAKFAQASAMLFDREALEMASTEALARFHANHYPAGVPVIDITVGIGADLIALAARGPAIGYEIDSTRADMARHNLAVYGVMAELHTADGLGADGEYVWADPARREAGRRSSSVELSVPSPFAIRDRFTGAKRLGIKLSPLSRDDDLERLGETIEFVSFGGECREALAWHGEEVQAEGFVAVHVESGDRLTRGGDLYEVSEPQAWFFEADPAAIRAHALDHFGADALGDSNGYLTSSERIDSPWLKTYRVLYHGRGDWAETMRALRELDASTPELKQRGPKLDLSALRKKLKLKGSRPVYVAIWQVGASQKHTILESAE